MSYKNLKIDAISGIGTGLILSLAIFLTYILYQHGIENKVFANNYTTSVLFSHSLATGTSAAPMALAGLNWFFCKTAVKKWRKAIRRWMKA
jgi:Na+/glutamate symporter